MPIHLPDLKLSLYTSPKVLSTSLKMWSFELENGRSFVPFVAQGQKKHIHALYPTRDFRDSKHFSDFTRIAFVRDPVDRFVSVYANRILRQHNSGRSARQFIEAGLQPTPSLLKLVNNFEKYRSVSAELEHHARPQVSFLGEDVTFFHHIFPMTQLPEFEKVVREIAGSVPHFPWEQQSGAARDSLTFQALRATRRIRELYSQDLEVFGEFF